MKDLFLKQVGLQSFLPFLPYLYSESVYVYMYHPLDGEEGGLQNEIHATVIPVRPKLSDYRGTEDIYARRSVFVHQ